MPHPALASSSLAWLLEQVPGQSIESVEIRGFQGRPYSHVWFIDARMAGQMRHLVAEM